MSGMKRRQLLSAATATLAIAGISRTTSATEIRFYFPVAVGGPIAAIIDGYAADFGRVNARVEDTAIYPGTYEDTLTKAQAARRAYSGPQMAALLSTEVFSLIDAGLIVSFDALLDSSADQAPLATKRPGQPRGGGHFTDKSIEERGST